MKFKIPIIFAVLLLLFGALQIEAYKYNKVLKGRKFFKHLKHTHKHKKTSTSEDKEKPKPLPANLKPSGGLDGTTKQEDFLKLCKNHHMSHGEIKGIFRVADRDHDLGIDSYEWDWFYQIFIVPFEECDSGKNYQLDKDELGKCLEGESLKGMNLGKDDTEIVFEGLDKEKDDQNVNFADYIFLRRANLAWKECAVDNALSTTQIRCALEISVPGRRLEYPEEKQIFQVAQITKLGVSNGQKAYLSFADYLQISHIYYYFHDFEIPFVDGTLAKKDILRSIDEQVLPTTLTPALINDMYGTFQNYDFAAFAATFWVHRLFTRHSKTIKFRLTEEEFMAALEEKTFPQLLLRYIDSYYNPTQEEIDAITGKKNRLTEKDYLINPAFLEIASKAVEKNEVNRKIQFTQFSNLLGQMDYPSLIQFFKLCWTFLAYDENKSMGVGIDEIRHGMKQFHSPIPFTAQDQRHLNQIMDFVSNSRKMTVNIKVWLAFFQYEVNFPHLRVQGSSNHCTFAKWETGTHNLGLKISRKSKGLSQEGADAVLQETTYNWRYGFKNCVQDECLVLRFRANDIPMDKWGEATENSKEDSKEDESADK